MTNTRICFPLEVYRMRGIAIFPTECEMNCLFFGSKHELRPVRDAKSESAFRHRVLAGAMLSVEHERTRTTPPPLAPSSVVEPPFTGAFGRKIPMSVRPQSIERYFPS